MNIKFLIAFIATLFAINAGAVTTVILEDGTVIETSSKVYISDVQLYKLEEASAVSETDALAEPEDKGSEEWCEWYLAINNGTIAPSFEEGYYIYTQNCREG